MPYGSTGRMRGPLRWTRNRADPVELTVAVRSGMPTT